MAIVDDKRIVGDLWTSEDGRMLVGKRCGNCSVAVELARYIDWFLTSSQADADVEYHLKVPVSQNISAVIRRSVLERMTCDEQQLMELVHRDEQRLMELVRRDEQRLMELVRQNEQSLVELVRQNEQRLMELVRQQKYNEAESLKTWKLPVQIVTPITAVIIFCLITYAVRQRIQYLRVLDHDDWKIDFVVPKKVARTLGDGSADGERADSSDGCDVHTVETRPLRIAPVFDVNRKVKQTLMRMRDEIEHANVARFFGISSHVDAVYLVEQHCANGTLVEFFRNNEHVTDQQFRYVVCADVASGMAYLHQQNLIHGNLSVNKCHVDSRWTVKIVDWEYAALYDVVRRTNRNQARLSGEKSVLQFVCDEADDSGSDVSSTFRHLAPEIQKDGLLSEPTRSGDVYSFGVIIHDLFVRFSGHEQENSRAEGLSRMPFKARQLMELACDKASVKRPTFEQLVKSLRCIGRKTNLLDRCVDFEIQVE